MGGSLCTYVILDKINVKPHLIRYMPSDTRSDELRTRVSELEMASNSGILMRLWSFQSYNLKYRRGKRLEYGRLASGSIKGCDTARKTLTIGQN